MSRTERVLVTGAAGFTGHYLCAQLRAQGHHVVGLTEFAPTHADEVQGNLLDRAALTRVVVEVAPDRVVHLAAIAFPGHADIAEIYRTNVEGSATLLEVLAASGQGQRGVLLASTATVYREVDSAGIPESASLNPCSHYAVSKLAMEHMAALYANRLPITVVRPFNYTGPGQREPFLVPKIVRHFADGSAYIELGNVDVVRDFLDVRTVADMYCRLLAAPDAAGAVVNICSGTGRSIRSLVTALEQITGRGMEIRINPQFVRDGEPREMVGSAVRLMQMIGPVPPIPFETTLRDMLSAATA